jgi:prepilin-type processing-associated H-X9-DG protein
LYGSLAGQPLDSYVPKPSGTALMADNTELSNSGSLVATPVSAFVRASHGHWEVNYCRPYGGPAGAANTYTPPTAPSRPMNPWVHEPNVNILFCDGHTESLPSQRAWGPYNYGDTSNIWDNL